MKRVWKVTARWKSGRVVLVPVEGRDREEAVVVGMIELARGFGRGWESITVKALDPILYVGS